MTEIPSWWLGVSGLFFVLAILAMGACVYVLVKVQGMLGEIMPQIKATANRVEEVATRVEEVSETVRTTVADVSGKARNMADMAAGMVTKTSRVVANQSPWIVAIFTALKIFRSIQDMRTPKHSSNGAGTKALPKPTAKAKHAVPHVKI